MFKSLLAKVALHPAGVRRSERPGSIAVALPPQDSPVRLLPCYLPEVRPMEPCDVPLPGLAVAYRHLLSSYDLLSLLP